MWLLPLLLVIPNFALNVTETCSSLPGQFANILLPSGIYLLTAAMSNRIGRTILLYVPVMVLCAFQIVLFFLYGGGIIAIDMFLNVATTNYHEATELLKNLGPAIATVVAIYLPLICAGVWAEVRRLSIPARTKSCGRRAATGLLIAGAVATGLALTTDKGYRPFRELFPVNAFHNIAKAMERSYLTASYPEVSAKYRFNACDGNICPNDSGLVVVVVVGETSRACNWQLCGYRRPTTPRLAARERLYFYPRTLSESNTTHKSVPLMLSHLGADEFNDSIFCTGSIIDTFKEAGYTTAWLSNQAHNRSLIDYSSARADHTDYICDGRHDKTAPVHDTALAPKLRDFINSCPSGKKIFVIIHTYGSHFNYKERYPEPDAIFMPDNSSVASTENRTNLVNAYDNSILATDKALDSFIVTLENCGRPCVMLYAADHGEDIYDDSRGRFLHASPSPTYYQLHVPMLVWLSASFAENHPEKDLALNANTEKNVSSSESMFHTASDLAGLVLPAFDATRSLCNNAYREPSRIYLNDYNESEPLSECGLRAEDFRKLKEKHISAN